MTAAEIVRLIATDPERLMRQVSLKVFGGSRSPSSAYEFIVVDAGRAMPGFTTGISGLLGQTKARPVFHIKLRRTAAPAEIAAAASGASFFAQYVAMRQVSDQPSDTHRMLPSRGGPDIMVTSQLTGCTFGIGSDAGGNRLVSHLQPPQSQKDPVLRSGALADATGRGFARDSDFSTFARGEDYQSEAVILGIRRDGAWHLYAQHIDFRAGGQDVARVTRLA
jgi:hypothetical protein